MAVIASDVFPGVSGAPRVVPLTHVTGPTPAVRISERKTAAKRSPGQQSPHGHASWPQPRKASMWARPHAPRSRSHRSDIRVWPSTRCGGQRGLIPTAARRFHKGMSSVPWVCFHIATTEPFNKGKLQMHTHMSRRNVSSGKCAMTAPVRRPLQVAAQRPWGSAQLAPRRHRRSPAFGTTDGKAAPGIQPGLAQRPARNSS